MLHHAICVESHKTVRYLVEHGANPNLDAAYEKVKVSAVVADGHLGKTSSVMYVR